MPTQAAAVIPFQFEALEVRTLLIDDQPWFVAMDVAAALLYSDAQAMTRKLDEDEIQNRQIVGFGNRGATLINESGLYSAILRSRKAEAKRFKKWVTAEVLPTIRKTGSYQAETIGGETIGTDGLKILRELIGKKVRVLPSSARNSAQHRIWNLVHTRFNVPKADMIAANDFDAAANFVANWAIEGEYLASARSVPAPSVLTRRDIEQHYYYLWAWRFHMDVLAKSFEDVVGPAFEKLSPELHAEWAKRFQKASDLCLECIEQVDPKRLFG